MKSITTNPNVRERDRQFCQEITGTELASYIKNIQQQRSSNDPNFS